MLTVYFFSGKDLVEVDNETVLPKSEGVTALDGNPFKPIGIGKPLSIRIHAVYTGDLPRRRQDVLLVSGVKSSSTFDATGRMINLIQKKVGDKNHLKFDAFNDGSPIVYYAKSLTDQDLRVSFEMTPDSFPDDIFNKISGLFKMAGGLPIFAPASAYLLAGSFLTQIFTDLGKSFLESNPVLSDTFSIQLDVGGVSNRESGIYFASNSSDLRSFKGFEPRLINNEYRMFNSSTSKEYNGTSPYLIFGVDGREESGLEELQLKVASAALLEKFYPTEEGAGVLVTELERALNVANDIKFRDEAERILKQLKTLKETDERFEKLKIRYDAIRANINLDEFKLPEYKPQQVEAS